MQCVGSAETYTCAGDSQDIGGYKKTRIFFATGALKTPGAKSGQIKAF